MGFKSGFVALVGRPNVGKSTLLNSLLGRKVSIVADKPQTTRNRIRGILNWPEGQLVMVDTPGIHRPTTRLGESMVHTAQAAARDVDVIWHVADLSRRPREEDGWAADLIRRTKIPGWLIANKVDVAAAPEEALAAYSGLAPYGEVFVVSALTGEGVEKLRARVLDVIPEGPQFFPPDMVTDQAEDFYIGEVIREKVLELTREEVPHSVAVTVDEKIHRREDLTYVRATIYVERETQRGILIGEGGRMSREIGRRARVDLEEYFGHQVYLEIWVKAQKRWRDRQEWLRRLGYDAGES